eukprot:TRINITY_DN7630_c0_g1_i4.p1 TRINITY_DN7630_c0_g1~~TRINITY_DN7630_c0_g1_i4.p1  ORF type:complete len:129 (-),score=20.04 TRINITY_DN7630_c0_g1_i4:855-1241(-)
MDQALLGKWLWRLGDESVGLWKQLLIGKYSISRNGWDVHDVLDKASAIWKGILSVKENFMENIIYRVGLGEHVLFWRDKWLGEWPLARQLPDIFNCALNKNARVHCYLSYSGEHKVWCPILRRNLKRA